MALLDYLYFVGSPESKKAPHISGEQKKIEKSLNFLSSPTWANTFAFLSQNKPNSKKPWDLSCLKPTVFGY
jgi:hypothetical protein